MSGSRSSPFSRELVRNQIKICGVENASPCDIVSRHFRHPPRQHQLTVFQGNGHFSNVSAKTRRLIGDPASVRMWHVLDLSDTPEMHPTFASLQYSTNKCASRRKTLKFEIRHTWKNAACSQVARLNVFKLGTMSRNQPPLNPSAGLIPCWNLCHQGRTSYVVVSNTKWSFEIESRP